jgi:hypothetical protein
MTSTHFSQIATSLYSFHRSPDIDGIRGGDDELYDSGGSDNVGEKRGRPAEAA